MKRRTFLKKGAIAASFTSLATWANTAHANPLQAQTPNAKGSAKGSATSNAIKPKALNLGDKVGLITPGSALSRQQFEQALANIYALNLIPQYSEHLRVRKGFLAGTDKQRLEDLHNMFADPSIKAIFCARGGYGTMRLLQAIDYTKIQQQPKIFLGYSDITALHMAVWQKIQLVCFHGPMPAAEWSTPALVALQALLFAPTAGYTLTARQPTNFSFSAQQAQVLSSGTAEGLVLGGNLTVLTALIGTPYFPDLTNCILCLEDVGESPYRIDRMLTQWRLAGIWNKVRGIALGTFSDCDTKPTDPDYGNKAALYEVLKQQLGALGIPVVYGLPFGHIQHNTIFPIGVPAHLDADNLQLKFTESPLEN